MAAMMTEHTAKAFDVDLQELIRLVAEMGGLAEKQIADSVDALAMRVANDLERIGDLAKNIGKRVAAISGDFHPQKLIRGVEHMAAMVLGQLKEVLDAFASHN